MSCGLSILRASHHQLLFILKISHLCHCRPQNIEPTHFHSVNKLHFLANIFASRYIANYLRGRKRYGDIKPDGCYGPHLVLSFRPFFLRLLFSCASIWICRIILSCSSIMLSCSRLRSRHISSLSFANFLETLSTSLRVNSSVSSLSLSLS